MAEQCRAVCAEERKEVLRVTNAVQQGTFDGILTFFFMLEIKIPLSYCIVGYFQGCKYS